MSFSTKIGVNFSVLYFFWGGEGLFVCFLQDSVDLAVPEIRLPLPQGTGIKGVRYHIQLVVLSV